MKSIIKHISNLLYLHDCVIIPGFGGFVCNKRSVFYDETKNTFYPPSKEVGFNRVLANSDGLLANFIAQKESIKYEEAVERINRFVKDLQIKLLSNNFFDFEDIGLFKRDISGNLLFTPKEEFTFLPDSLGLTFFRFYPIEQKQVTKIEFQNDIVPSIKKHFIKNWIAAAVVITCFFFFSTDLKTPNTSQAGFFNDILNFPDEKALLSEYNDITENDVTENEIDKNPENCISENFENNENVKITSKRYHIIGASHTRYNQAKNDLEKFKSEGFPDATILDNGNGKIRISLLSFSDKEEATSVLDKMRKETKFSTFWMLVF